MTKYRWQILPTNHFKPTLIQAGEQPTNQLKPAPNLALKTISGPTGF